MGAAKAGVPGTAVPGALATAVGGFSLIELTMTLASG